MTTQLQLINIIKIGKILVRRLGECKGTCQMPTVAGPCPDVAVTFLEKLTANPKIYVKIVNVSEPENAQRRIALWRCDRGWAKGGEGILLRFCGDLTLTRGSVRLTPSRRVVLERLLVVCPRTAGAFHRGGSGLHE